MKEKTSWTLNVVYGLLIVIVCIALFVTSSLLGWKHRTDSSAVFLFAGSALFFSGVAVMLIAQGIIRSRYRSAAHEMAFSPFRWNTEATDEMLDLVMEGRQEVTIGDNYHGKIDGLQMYVFNYSRGPAWWNKTRTIVTSRLNGSLPEDLAQSIKQQAEASVEVSGRWLVIRSRNRIPAKNLKPWLTSIAATLNKAKV